MNLIFTAILRNFAGKVIYLLIISKDNRLT